MKAVETEIEDKETIDYLRLILNRTLLIANPTRLNIPGIGEGTATSMVQYRAREGLMESYFSFTVGEEKMEFHRRDNRYYQEIQK